MPSISTSIAHKIILASSFVLAIFVAVEYQNMDTTMWAVFLFLFAFIIAFAFEAGERLSDPLRKFLTKAEHISNGNFAGRFYSQSKDELGHLSRVFDKIAHTLGQNKTDIRKLQEVFDGKVETITELMGETIDALEEKVKNRSTELQKVSKDFVILQQQLKMQTEHIASLEKKLAKPVKSAKKKNARTS